MIVHYMAVNRDQVVDCKDDLAHAIRYAIMENCTVVSYAAALAERAPHEADLHPWMLINVTRKYI